MDTRDGAHGIAVWGVGVLIGAMLATSAVGTTARIAGSAAETAATAAGAVGDAVGSAASAAGSAASTAAGEAAENLSQELRTDPFAYAADKLLRGDGGAQSARLTRTGQEARQILMSVMRTGEIPDDDREYLYSMVAQNTDLSEDEMRQRVDRAVESVETARHEAIDAAEAAEAARVYAVISAFVLAAALLLAGAAAYWAAGLGGRHRDEGHAFAHFGRWD